MLLIIVSSTLVHRLPMASLSFGEMEKMPFVVVGGKTRRRVYGKTSLVAVQPQKKEKR